MRVNDDYNYVPHPAVTEAFRDRTVLITGAAGSIGAELARQVGDLPIAKLVLLDRDENATFELMRSCEKSRTKPPHTPSVSTAILGDIRDRELVRHTFAQWRPSIVLHAAAYKHVPMMEANPCEAVLNNVTGTRILADAAIDFGCERFLLISTDKAVKPASVMGATKRLAELLIQDCASATTATSSPLRSTYNKTLTNGDLVFASVRFVNVIGSRGSVVPIFHEQIAAGGPVTITDEEMTRFFMSVERAAGLLLEAATLGDSGCIYALETGSPMRITDLAHEMIEAAGLVAGKDISIEITGIRPGEKLRERLHGDSESLHPTPFRGIDRVHSLSRPAIGLARLQNLELAAHQRDSERVIELLEQLPLAYKRNSIESSPLGPLVVASEP
jgi:FlaA1/EpsC-like NDP-sugar epimerase